ncbi:MAG: autoinducer binding domain-containing protein [Hyphomonas sp.]|nr:autoinducer binding domain-containing protein [Hyphomonas sp.]
MLGHLRQIARARTVEEMFERSVAALTEIGLSRVYFQGPIGSDRSLTRNTYSYGFPEIWAQTYEVRWQVHDPFPDAAARYPGPLYWHRLPSSIVLNADELAYLDFLKQNGMEQGLCILLYGNATRVGFLGASPGPDGPAVETVDRELFQFISMAAFTRYCQLVTMDPELPVALSGRELDVLYWMAQGRSNGAIAEVLGISQDTVNTYVKRVFAKMNVFDRTSAVMKGVQHGLVIVSDPISELVAEQMREKRHTGS